MVAEALPETSVSHPKRKGRGQAPAIDLFTRSKARNLYVVRQISAKEVAEQCGLTIPQVYTLAQREGWTKTRVAMRQKQEQAAHAREERDISELVEAVAVKSQVLSLGTLDSAITELATPGEFQAKNLQALSVAAKNFVGLYRQAKSLDVAAQSGNVTNVLFIACQRAGMNEQASSLPAPATKAEPINVTPSAAQVAPEA